MRVLQVAAEMYPLMKTGGLADVVGSLPPALSGLGVECAVLLPGYAELLKRLDHLEDGWIVTLPGSLGSLGIRPARVNGIDHQLFVVDSNEWFNRPGSPYGADASSSYQDNPLRFAAFCAAAAEVAQKLWPVDVVHAHDWHAGLCGAYLSLKDCSAALVHTIHNLAYQGIFDSKLLTDMGLPGHLHHIDALEFYGALSFMKGGINFAQKITTVSPTYSREIQTREFGHGLDGLLRHRSAVLSGILNGVDYSIWNPAADSNITSQYDGASVAERSPNRGALVDKFGLDDIEGPVVGVVSRLTPQKGLDLLLEVTPLAIDRGMRFVILGNGDHDLEEGFQQAARQFPGRVGVFLGYDEVIAHQVYAGADAVLIPSRFEPCGLTQLYAMRYGALPVARRTGGLADTIIDIEDAGDSGTGFLFESAWSYQILQALEKMVGVFENQKRWQRAMRVAMSQDFSWLNAAQQYHDIYRELTEQRTIN